MSRKIIAFYNNFRIANGAVRELVDYGFPRESITVVADSTNGAYGYLEKPMKTGVVLTSHLPDEYRAGTRIGGSIGAAFGLVGGFMAGTGAWAIPGIEPGIATGLAGLALWMLVSTAGFAIAGGIVGRVLGALIGLGIPEEEAEQYAESVRQSGVLVSVKAEAYNARLIREVLDRYRPMEIADKANQEPQPAWQKIRAKVQPVYAQDWERAHRR